MKTTFKILMILCLAVAPISLVSLTGCGGPQATGIDESIEDIEESEEMEDEDEGGDEEEGGGDEEE